MESDWVESGVDVSRGAARTQATEQQHRAINNALFPDLWWSGLPCVILPLAVVLGCVLEFLDATAKTAHELWNLPASKEQENNEDNQNDLCRSYGTHPVDFGGKFGEIRPCSTPRVPNSPPNKCVNSHRQHCQ